MRRLLLIIAFILVVIAIGAGLYFAFFRGPKTEEPKTPSQEELPTGALPSAGLREPGVRGEDSQAPGALPQASNIAQGGITRINSLVRGTVRGATGTADGKALNYYDEESGKFYTVGPDGKIQELSSRAFFNVEKVSWAPSREKAVLEYPDGSNIIYNFKTDKQVTLPKHWEEFDFSPTSNEVTGLSVGIDPANRWLFTANSDGTGAKIIEPLGNNADKVQVAWSPNDQVIAFSKTGEAQGFGREQVLLIGKNRENFRGLIVEGLNFEGTWSPDGLRVLYSVASPDAELRPSLWIVNGQGDAIGTDRRSLGLSTWSHKCAFSGSATLYCAAPINLARGAGLEPDIAIGTPENFYKINLTTGSKTLIAVPESTVNAVNLLVSSDGATLFFHDALNGGISSLRLK